MGAMMMLFMLVIVVATTATVVTLAVMRLANPDRRRPYLPPPPRPSPLPPPSHPGTAADFVGGPQPPRSPGHRLSAGDRERIMVLLRGRQKIQAVKLYRTLTGAGLREAKDAVDHLERYQ